MTNYSDGGTKAITNTRGRVQLRGVSSLYEDQNFHLVLNNLGAVVTIYVYVTPLGGDEEVITLTPGSPGIVLDGLSWKKFFNGIEAVTSAGNADLEVNLYSNDITWVPAAVKEAALINTNYPRDTTNYGTI